MSVFFIIAWTVALVAFLMVPSLSTRERRKKLWDTLCFWKKRPENEQESSGQENGGESENEVFHYRLSSAQEDEIRECFLLDQIKSFTTTLQAEHIQMIKGNDDDDNTPLSIESSFDNESSSSSTTTGRGESALADLEAPPPSLPVSDRDGNNSNHNNIDCYESSGELEEDANSCCAMDQFEGDFCGHITVPQPGVPSTLLNVTATRQVPNGCAVCLCPFSESDEITWSSNHECNHVFHKSCIMTWLKTSGRRHLRRRRRQEQQREIVAYAVDPLVKITKFPMLCPCCRQVFVIKTTDESNNHEIKNKSAAQGVVKRTTAADSSVPSNSSSTDESSMSNMGDEDAEAVSTSTPEEPIAISFVSASQDNV